MAVAVAVAVAEIGVILLLFGVGLRFHLREIIAVWRVALPGALIQSTATSLLLALARMVNPQLRVLVRRTHLRDAPALKRAGASVVARVRWRWSRR